MGIKMSDEVEAETTEETLEEMTGRTPDEYEAEIKRLRREAAGKRIQNKEKEAELNEFREWKEAQKTEAERLLERAESAEKTLVKERKERLQERVAKKVGLDPDLADRIRGEDESEMMEDATQMAGKTGPRRDVDPFSLTRGETVRSGDSTSNQFSNWFQGQI